MDYQIIEDRETNAQLTNSDLTSIFDLDGIVYGESLKKLESFGGVQGLAKKLNTNLQKGLTSGVDVDHNRQMFGDNAPNDKEPSFKDELQESFKDGIIILLLIGLLISIILDIFTNFDGIIENLSIFVVILAVVLLESLNNYYAQIKLNKWKMSLKDKTCSVIRNTIVQIPQKDLVVGDILLFKQGDIFIADGLMISGHQVKIDESQMRGESELVSKQSYQQKQNPFLISGTKCVKGAGSMLVLAVGQYSMHGKIRELILKDDDIPFQDQVTNIATSLANYGLITAASVFIILSVQYVYECTQGTATFLSLKTLQVIVQSFMISIAIIIVAVPQRLPFAQTIPLAYSLNSERSLLINNQKSCEKMSYVNEILCSKSVLTESKMKVTQIWSQDRISYVGRDQLDKSTIELISENISYNSQVMPNNIEQALQQFVKNVGQDAQNQNDQILTQIPFDCETKTMTTTIFHDKTKTIRVYIKGASDKILKQCTKFIGNDGQELPLDSNYQSKIENQIIENFETQCLKPIVIAYRAVEYSGNMQYVKQFANKLSDGQSNEFVLVAILGLKNLIRCEAPSAIKYCQELGINVRMVTGDNIKIAQIVAQECGILQRNKELRQFEIMKSQDFNNLVEGKITQMQQGEEVQTVKNTENFKKISQELQVLANANSFDKQLLVLGLKNENNRVVAVVGDEIGDAEVFKTADVGLAMGIKGTDAAIDASDFILLDESFKSVLYSIYLGRSIQNRIRMFVYFQLTAITVFLALQLVGLLLLKKLPLNIIQMLWINLITDLSASLALTTEFNHYLNKPYRQDDQILSKPMKKAIIIEAIYQISVLCFVFLITHNFVEFENEQQKIIVLFQTFVFFQIFNMLAIRLIDSKNFISFAHLFSNSFFWLIMLLILIIQFIFIEFGGLFQSGGHLSLIQNFFCIGFGLGVILLQLLIKSTIGQPWSSDSHLEEKQEKLKQ